MANEHSTSCLVDRDALTLLTDAPVQPLKSEVRYNSIRTMSICRIYNVGTKTQNETLTAHVGLRLGLPLRPVACLRDLAARHRPLHRPSQPKQHSPDTHEF
jgi:hypothetical protein